MSFGFKNLLRGIRLVPVNTTAVSVKGDLEVLDSSGKLNFFNGTSASPVVTEAHSATISNKTLTSVIIDSDLNTITNIVDADVKSTAAIQIAKLLAPGINHVVISDGTGLLTSEATLAKSRGGSGQDNSSITFPATGVLVTEAGSQTLTNKSISASTNTITNITDTSIAAAGVANIARNKLASGTAAHVIINDGSGVLSSEAALSAVRGGTGIVNNAAATLTRSGNHALTLTTTAISSLTLPVSGTLSTLAGVETLSNKSFSDSLTTAEVSTPSTPASGFGRLYFKTDGKIYSLNDTGTESELLTQSSSEPRNNFLYNSNFDIWQRGTSVAVPYNTYQYLADRWYCFNDGGTGSVLTYSRVAGTSDGAKYAAKVQYTTAPGVTGTKLQFRQTLENFDSLKLYNKTVSLSVKLKAFGNVNSVVVSLLSDTAENKTATNVLAATTGVINTSGFTTIVINNISVGTAMTLTGALTVSLLVTNANITGGGNFDDLNNGFAVEQVQLNIGSTVAEYQSQFKLFAAELEACQRYYEKSYDYSVVPGTASSEPGLVGGIAQTPSIINVNAVFKTQKRITPAQTTNWLNYGYNGSVNGVSDYNSTGVVATTSTALKLGDKQLTGISASPSAYISGNHYWFHWVCDCEI